MGVQGEGALSYERGVYVAPPSVASIYGDATPERDADNTYYQYGRHVCTPPRLCDPDVTLYMALAVWERELCEYRGYSKLRTRTAPRVVICS